jgi:hypothetical protein
MRRTLVCNEHETVSALTAKRVLLDAVGRVAVHDQVEIEIGGD